MPEINQVSAKFSSLKQQLQQHREGSTQYKVSVFTPVEFLHHPPFYRPIRNSR